MPSRSFSKSEWMLIASMALMPLMLHVIINMNGAYGFFRDELYYIACSDHLSWGYVDQPPLSIFLLKFMRVLFGDSLVAIRLLPALAISATIVVSAFIVNKMNGGRMAIMITSIAIMFSPIHLAMGSYYSMNSIDIFIWSIIILILLNINEHPTPALWILLGVVLGLGLLNKISVLFLGAGIVGSIILSRRKWLLTPWPYVAGLISMLIFLPYVLWNVNHDYAHLEFIRNASGKKYAGRSAWDFVKEIIINHNPLSLLLWLAGLVTIWFYKPLKTYSIIGWLFLIPLIILLVNKTSKGEYLTPAFVIVFAAGAIYVEQRFAKWLNVLYMSLLVISALLLLPLATPILPVEKYIAYTRSLGMKPYSNEKKRLADLPQFYADMYGWPEKARDVAKVFQTLSEQDKKRCAIYSDNYGRCGAIDFFGEAYGLPKSIGGHNNYWIWGPREYIGDVVIILGGELEDHKDDFESCIQVGISTCAHCMPYENDVKIFLCRKFKAPLKEAWKGNKNYN
jgi:hypothetical protein